MWSTRLKVALILAIVIIGAVVTYVVVLGTPLNVISKCVFLLVLWLWFGELIIKIIRNDGPNLL